MTDSPVLWPTRRSGHAGAPPPGVAFAQIDPTSVCDLHCTFCVGRDWVQAHMKAELFDAVIDQLPGLRYVQLQGEGEPMLARRFWLHLERLRGLGVDVGFTTNGRHLDEHAVERLAAAGVRTIAVSIDSLDLEIYEDLRGGDVALPVAGLRRLAASRRGGMDVFITSVLTRASFATFDGIIALSEELGLSPPSCQGLQRSPTYVRHYRNIGLEADGLDDEQQAWVRDYLQQRSRHRRDHGLQSYYEAITAAGGHDDRCPFVRASVHVRFDGAIFPCCFMKEDHQALGNLNETRLDDVAIRSVRSELLSEIQAGGTPERCAGCHVIGS